MAKKQKQSLRALVGQLLAPILQDRYPAGTRLPAERELAKSLSVSRNSLREALAAVQQFGLLKPIQGSGIVVRDFRESSTLAILPTLLSLGLPGFDRSGFLLQLMEMNRFLFDAVVGLACRRSKKQGIDLDCVRRSVAEAAAETGDPQRAMRLEYQVARDLCRATGNLPVLWLYNSLSPFYQWLFEGQMLPLVRRVYSRLPDYPDYMNRVLQAIEQGDDRLAHQVVFDHFDAAENAMLERLAGARGEHL